MTEFIQLIEVAARVGLPLIISLFVVVVGIKLVPKLITRSEQYWKKRDESLDKQQALLENTQKKYDEQMKMILTVAQQGVEVARRGNEVIERNNLVIEDSRATHNLFVQTIERFNDEARGVKCLQEKNNDTSQKVYTEVLRLGDEVRRIT